MPLDSLEEQSFDDSDDTKIDTRTTPSKREHTTTDSEG